MRGEDDEGEGNESEDVREWGKQRPAVGESGTGRGSTSPEQGEGQRRGRRSETPRGPGAEGHQRRPNHQTLDHGSAPGSAPDADVETAGECEPAALDRRILAGLVDAFIAGWMAAFLAPFLTPVVVAFLALVGVGWPSIVAIDPVWYLGLPLLMLGYFLVLEATVGYTFGKEMFSIEVRTTAGEPIGWWESTGRNLLRIVDLLPGFYLVGLAVVMTSDRSQRLGDVAADTLVVDQQ